VWVVWVANRVDSLGGKKLTPDELADRGVYPELNRNESRIITERLRAMLTSKATMLFPVSLSSHGGDTQYVNMHEAYDDLPAATKERIDGLKAVHVYLRV